jgi:hypothetical protein
MANAEPGSFRVGISIPANLPLPPAEGANFFHFTVVGEEVQFLVGTINLLRLHEAKTRGETISVVPEITHRFLLSPLGFNSLKSQLEEIAKAAPKSGVGMAAQAG